MRCLRKVLDQISRNEIRKKVLGVGPILCKKCLKKDILCSETLVVGSSEAAGMIINLLHDSSAPSHSILLHNVYCFGLQVMELIFSIISCNHCNGTGH
jgi:hypothetical protein